ncbi:MAG: hypothetical protein LUQ71_10195 [Methanoregula sp.]|nr:hypothetical protein [Methanoregula sp.]
MSGTYTENLNLYKMASEETGYEDKFATSMETIDTEVVARMKTPTATPTVGCVPAWDGSKFVWITPVANKVLIGVNGAVPSFVSLLSSIITVDANIPMKGFTLTGLPAATGNGQPARYDEFAAEITARAAGDTAAAAAAVSTTKNWVSTNIADGTLMPPTPVVAGTTITKTISATTYTVPAIKGTIHVIIFLSGPANATSGFILYKNGVSNQVYSASCGTPGPSNDAHGYDVSVAPEDILTVTTTGSATGAYISTVGIANNPL